MMNSNGVVMFLNGFGIILGRFGHHFGWFGDGLGIVLGCVGYDFENVGMVLDCWDGLGWFGDDLYVNIYI